MAWRLPPLRRAQSRVQEIIKQCVVIEQEFVSDALPVSLIGMNCAMMSRYIEFCADRLLVALNCGKVYNTANPFEWMNLISLQVCAPQCTAHLQRDGVHE